MGVFGACTRGPDDATSNGAVTSRPPAPVPQILDGARRGNPHFFFLPPLVPPPTYSGTSDGSQSPTVLVCDWLTPANAMARCGEVVALFSLVSGSGSEVIRYDATSEQYIVNWHTDRCVTGACTLDASKIYRIRVLVGSIELGHADVDVVSSGSQLKNVETNEYLPLLNGRTLPIKFRIEAGAVAIVASGGAASVGTAGGELASANGSVALSIPPGALTSTTSIAISSPTQSLPGSGAWSPPVELGPDGTTFATPVTLTLSYDVSKLPPGVLPEALKLSTWVIDHWEEVPGSTLDVGDATVSAPISHFSTYGLSIWPNHAVGQSGPLQLYVGQQGTFTGATWTWITQPNTYCYTQRTWIQFGSSGFWTYRTYCSTYTTTMTVGVAGVRIDWRVADPTVARVEPPSYSITSQNGRTTSPPFTALAAGVTDVFGELGNVRARSVLTVLPSLTFDVFGSGSAPLRRFGFGQGTGLNVRIPTSLSTPLTVALSHSNPAVAGSNPSVVVAAGATQGGVTISAGSTAGRDTLIGTAPGYGPDTLIIETGPGRIFVEGWPVTLAYGDSAAIRVRPMNPDSSIIDNAWSTTFALASNGALAFTRNNAAITSISVPDGTSATPVFYVKGIAAGSGTMTVTNAQYVTGPYTTIVAPPPFTTIQVAPNPATVRPGQTVALTATARDAQQQAVTGVTVTWTSSNTAVATVDANGVVTGVANGAATITARNGTIAGTSTVHVGTPSIAVSATSLTIQVQQGQSSSATINITNGGTGLLTGLSTGPLSSYFTGALTPWVTASLSSTTAPATLTLTATPGMSVPASAYQLRFDIMAPGAANTPYTLYSINVTVVAAGVTPVNATIAPNPTALSFSVVQGQVATRTITINNSGTDPLTNLTVGPFSNYFNGQATPWVSASVAPTTAPATLTITAAPTLSTSPGTQQLRFDVMSPGATNSPYTFYSINVTVVAAPPDPVFSIANLGTLGGSGSSEAYGINGNGRIVGVSNGQGFYVDPASSGLLQVPNPYGDIWWAFDVNSTGVIAAMNPYVGFTWDPATNTRLGPPPGPFTQNNRTTVWALNNTGLVLACADNGAYAQNYIWNTATNATTLIPSAFNSCRGRINDNDIALVNADPGAGGTSRLWNQGTLTATVIPSLGGVTVGRDLNATGVAVGFSMVGGQQHAFRYDPATGVTRDLGTLGGNASEALGINDAGYIVGWSLNAAGQRRGFLWDPTQQRMYELPVLAGHDEGQAADINNAGVIAGYSAQAGLRRAVRWTPQ